MASILDLGGEPREPGETPASPQPPVEEPTETPPTREEPAVEEPTPADAPRIA